MPAPSRCTASSTHPDIQHRTHRRTTRLADTTRHPHPEQQPEFEMSHASAGRLDFENAPNLYGSRIFSKLITRGSRRHACLRKERLLVGREQGRRNSEVGRLTHPRGRGEMAWGPRRTGRVPSPNPLTPEIYLH